MLKSVVWLLVEYLKDTIMLFNSLAFLAFFPLVCLVYFLIPSNALKIRNAFLLLASYYFYMNWEPSYALLLGTSTLITYLTALGIQKERLKRYKKHLLALGIGLNILILFFFKYYNFLGGEINALFVYLGIGMKVPKFQVLLPVGISFYVFQAIGYAVDVYRGTTRVEKCFFTYALFVSFFPQLVAGPIERSNQLLPQFKEKHSFDYSKAIHGLSLMAWGYFLKLALADKCGIYVDAILNNLDAYAAMSYLFAILLFPFQIYGDFAGYSLIAIGVSKVLGFDLMTNFCRPYFACSIGDFWHRWHISLSTWFKDYVYIPLGGNRVGKVRNYLNLLITFLISGIWHGANWTFVAWGSLHGLYLCIEKACGVDVKRYKGMKRVVHWAGTFALVAITWVFFRMNSLREVAKVLEGLVFKPGRPLLDKNIMIPLFITLIILFVKETLEEYKPSMIENKEFLRPVCIVLIAIYILFFGVLDGGQFIYFQF